MTKHFIGRRFNYNNYSDYRLLFNIDYVLSIGPLNLLSIYLCIHPSICHMSVCLSIYPSIHSSSTTIYTTIIVRSDKSHPKAEGTEAEYGQSWLKVTADKHLSQDLKPFVKYLTVTPFCVPKVQSC